MVVENGLEKTTKYELRPFIFRDLYRYANKSRKITVRARLRLVYYKKALIGELK